MQTRSDTLLSQRFEMIKKRLFLLRRTLRKRGGDVETCGAIMQNFFTAVIHDLAEQAGVFDNCKHCARV